MDFVFNDNYKRLQECLQQTVKQEQTFFETLRREISPLRGTERALHRRAANALAVVASDGGNNQVLFDPFLLHVVQIVDSQRNVQYGPEVLAANTQFEQLLLNHIDKDKKPKTCLGKLMVDLGIDSWEELSYAFNKEKAKEKPFAWIYAYRELIEWACLYEIITTKDFSNDTILLFDGLLRSFAFRDKLFSRFAELVQEHIDNTYRKKRRKVYLVGMAKRSKFLDRYRLAMFLEGVLRLNYPACVAVPGNIEEKAYHGLGYILIQDSEIPEIKIKHSMGCMYMVKFGSNETDPIWPVDIFHAQIDEANKIIEALLSDALDGFPVPMYPLALQKAHEYASIVDLDYRILQDVIMKKITNDLGAPDDIVEKFCMQDLRIADRRYPEGGF